MIQITSRFRAKLHVFEAWGQAWTKWKTGFLFDKSHYLAGIQNSSHRNASQSSSPVTWKSQDALTCKLKGGYTPITLTFLALPHLQPRTVFWWNRNLHFQEKNKSTAFLQYISPDTTESLQTQISVICMMSLTPKLMTPGKKNIRSYRVLQYYRYNTERVAVTTELHETYVIFLPLHETHMQGSLPLILLPHQLSSLSCCWSPFMTYMSKPELWFPTCCSSPSVFPHPLNTQFGHTAHLLACPQIGHT